MAEYKDGFGLSKPKDDDCIAPDIFASPEKKQSKDYCLQMARYIYWDNWNTYGNAFGISNRSNMIDNIMWANGTVDLAKWAAGNKEKRGRTNSNPIVKYIQQDLATEMPKFKDIVVGYCEDLDFEIQANNINPLAVAEKENKKLYEEALVMNNAFYKQIEEVAGVEIAPKTELPFEPANRQEIETFYLLNGFKDAAEIEIETSFQIAKNDSDWDAHKKQWLEDAFSAGVMTAYDYYDNAGRLKTKRVDPVNAGVQDFNGHYLRRPTRYFFVETMSVYQVLVEGNGQITIEQAMELAKKYQNMLGNPSWDIAQDAYNAWNRQYVNTDSKFGYPSFFYTWYIPVATVGWEDVEIYPFKKKQNESNTEITPISYTDLTSEQYKGQDRAEQIDSMLSEVSIHCYYQASWIPGTEYIWNFGKVPYQARDPRDVRYALCPLKYYRVGNQSMAERIKYYEKKKILTWQKIDREIANMVPLGYKFNIKALENISLGQGQTFTTQHAIEMFYERGSIIYADEAQGDDYGRTVKKDPVVPIQDNGIGNRLNALLGLINAYQQQIAQITGINEFTDGSNPNANAPATIAKLSAQGTKHSLSQIAGGLKKITEEVAIDLTERIRVYVRNHGEYHGYVDALGNGIISAMRVTDKIVPHAFAISIQAKPTASERESMKAVIRQAFTNMASPEQGGLWAADTLYFEQMIDAGVSMKIVRLIMEARQRQNLKALNDAKQQSMEMQGQLNDQNMKLASKVKAEEYKQEKATDLEYEQALTIEIIKRNNADNVNKTQNKLATDTNKSQLKRMENVDEQINAQ